MEPFRMLLLDADREILAERLFPSSPGEIELRVPKPEALSPKPYTQNAKR